MSIPVPPEDLRATQEERELAQELAIAKLMRHRDDRQRVIPFGNIDIIHATHDEIIRIVREREAKGRN